MSTRMASYFSRRKTSQSDPIPGESQVQNSAGGYVYEADKWSRLLRYLILGSDGGTYYADEKKLSVENAGVVLACLKDDHARTVKAIVDVSVSGRAPKNDPAIFALALAASVTDPDLRASALRELSKVCRIPTHLFHFMTFILSQRGMSRGLRGAISNWYALKSKDINGLAYQLVKYQQRDGWSNRDVFRVARFNPAEFMHTDELRRLFRWVVGASADAITVKRKNAVKRGDNGERRYPAMTSALPSIVVAYEEAKTADTDRLVALIEEFGLTHEMLPSEKLKEPDVWRALLRKMPLEAMVRNLGRMTSLGVLKPLAGDVNVVSSRLRSTEYIRSSRLHPMGVLLALDVYKQGHSEKGSLTWTPVADVIDALHDAFHLGFENAVATNKRIMLALDVSGSMATSFIGSHLSCREASAALALVTLSVEPNCFAVGFSDGISGLKISRRQRLDEAVAVVSGLPFQRTDCALPMLHALREEIDVDAFVIVTDNETWCGDIHPSQALRDYRRKRVSDAKLVVVSMTPTQFTTADPNDAGMLDVVGFDTNTPSAISAFIGAKA